MKDFDNTLINNCLKLRIAFWKLMKAIADSFRPKYYQCDYCKYIESTSSDITCPVCQLGIMVYKEE